jgi:hypothetical protein
MVLTMGATFTRRAPMVEGVNKRAKGKTNQMTWSETIGVCYRALGKVPCCFLVERLGKDGNPSPAFA